MKLILPHHKTDFRLTGVYKPKALKDLNGHESMPINLFTQQSQHLVAVILSRHGKTELVNIESGETPEFLAHAINHKIGEEGNEVLSAQGNTDINNHTNGFLQELSEEDLGKVVIISSPIGRAMETAKLQHQILQQEGFNVHQEVITHKGLRSPSYGSLNGKNIFEVYSAYGKGFRQLIERSEFTEILAHYGAGLTMIENLKEPTNQDLEILSVGERFLQWLYFFQSHESLLSRLHTNNGLLERIHEGIIDELNIQGEFTVPDPRYVMATNMLQSIFDTQDSINGPFIPWLVTHSHNARGLLTVTGQTGQQEAEMKKPDVRKGKPYLLHLTWVESSG